MKLQKYYPNVTIDMVKALYYDIENFTIPNWAAEIDLGKEK